MTGKYVKIGAKITLLKDDISTTRVELRAYSEIAKYNNKRFFVWSPMSHNSLSFSARDTICVFNVGREGEVAELRTVRLTEEGLKYTIVLGVVRDYEVKMYTIKDVCKILLVNVIPLTDFEVDASITENELAERVEKTLKKVKENER